MNLFLLEIDPYAGPLDLLLYLIREKRLTIEEISLADVADQYMVFLDNMESLNLAVASSYLVVAATLIYIKSRFMLPGQQVAENNEDEMDLKEQLMARIRENLLFKQAAEHLDRQPRLYREYFPRPDQSAIYEETSVTWLRPSVSGLVDAFRNALIRSAKRVVPAGKAPWRPLRIHISLMTHKLAQCFAGKGRLALAELSEELADDTLSSGQSLLLSFLAMLQMSSRGLLRAVQKVPFETIWMESGAQWDVSANEVWTKEIGNE